MVSPHPMGILNQKNLSSTSIYQFEHSGTPYWIAREWRRVLRQRSVYLLLIWGQKRLHCVWTTQNRAPIFRVVKIGLKSVKKSCIINNNIWLGNIKFFQPEVRSVFTSNLHHYKARNQTFLLTKKINMNMYFHLKTF